MDDGEPANTYNNDPKPYQWEDYKGRVVNWNPCALVGLGKRIAAEEEKSRVEMGECERQSTEASSR